MPWKKIFFWALAAACFLISPPVALALGLVLAFTAGNPYPSETKTATKYLLQASVVLLGFGMNLRAVVEAGKDGVLFTIATIFGTLALGFLVGKLLKINDKISALVSSGTAICGGSAIAAVAPAIDADADETSVALGTVFILNSVALFVFPVIGHFYNLTEPQFGVWAAVAIHDTSSVVGAAARFGAEALQVATTVKLARALWIAPVALIFAFLYRSKKAKIAVPYFIFFFLLATAVRTYVPLQESFYEFLVVAAKKGLTVTLFLIGASLSRDSLRKVGVRPLAQGVVLWLVISIVSLFAVVNLL